MAARIERQRTVRHWFLVREGLFYTALTLVGLVMLLPFAWTVGTSFKPDSEIFTPSLELVPRSFTVEQYRIAFDTFPFERYFLNSLILAVAGVASNLLLGSLAGFAFARLRFPARDAIFRGLLTSMMIPGVVTLIPTFIILRSFPLFGGNNLVGEGGIGLLNTFAAVILPGAAGAFAVFMMRQFFLTLPSEIGEASRLDGASEFRTFWQIYLPLCKPALATLAIFTFRPAGTPSSSPWSSSRTPTRARSRWGSPPSRSTTTRTTAR